MRFFRASIIVFFCLLMPGMAAAMEKDPALLSVFEKRVDLQAAFDPETWQARPDSPAGFLIDLRDWAVQYGWREHAELAAYKPAVSSLPVRTGATEPSEVTADAYIVLDRASGEILAARYATSPWPIASITKLMTATVVLDEQTPLSETVPVYDNDDVGGAKLYVEDGTSFSVQDLLYATLVASANNAANALAHSTDLSRETFIGQMNSKADDLGLPHTEFVDPTGIELGNVSTAREIARLAMFAFSRQDISTYTSTPSRVITAVSDGEKKTMINTNWMLWKPEFEDLYVTSGKTGYLNESGWNVVVSLRSSPADAERELLLVVFGADSRIDSFRDARTLAEWAWSNHSWVPNE